MSDQSQGPGWWQASDGKWYAPEQHPDYRPPVPPPVPPPTPQAPASQPPSGTPMGQEQRAPQSRSEAKADAKAAAARAKAMRPWFKKKRFWVLGLLAIIIVATVASSSGGDDDGGNDGGSKDPVTNVLGVGDTDNTSGLDVTLLTVESPVQLGQFDSEPEPGNRYIGVELSVTNTSDEDQVLSTLLNTELKDETGQRFDIALVGLDRPQIDGTVLPGDTLRGWAVFEVPEASKGLILIVKGSITASGVRFDLGLE